MNILHVTTGPCEAQATFTCTGTGMLRLNPLAMLPASEVPNAYVPICQPCYDHLADAYVAGTARARHMANCWGFADGWGCESDCPIAEAHYARVQAERRA